MLKKPGKNIFSRLWGWGGVVILIALWVQVPVIAQTTSQKNVLIEQKTLEEQLLGTKETITSQIEIIEDLKNKLSMTTSGLTEEIDFLKFIYDRQAKIIKQMFDNFFQVTGELNTQIDALSTRMESLKAKNAELEAAVADKEKMREEYATKTQELTTQIESLTAKNAGLGATIADKEKTIGELRDDFFRTTEKFQAQVSSLEKANAGLNTQIKALRTQRLILSLGLLVAAVLAIYGGTP